LYYDYYYLLYYLLYNFYNNFTKYVNAIPMQNSLLQTTFFIIFMMCIYCSASMLPCGRYYYEPEGGYVGNPWVKFSYQFAYLYLGWFLHHLDILDHYIFQFSQTFSRKYISLKHLVKNNKGTSHFSQNSTPFFKK
jgi:hypothetical protein